MLRIFVDGHDDDMAPHPMVSYHTASHPMIPHSMAPHALVSHPMVAGRMIPRGQYLLGVLSRTHSDHQGLVSDTIYLQKGGIVT